MKVVAVLCCVYFTNVVSPQHPIYRAALSNVWWWRWCGLALD